MAEGRLRSRLSAYAALVLLACAAGYVVAVGVELWHQAQDWAISHRELDFPSYYLAAHRLLQGQDIYSGLRTEARLRLGMEGYFIDSAVGPPAFAMVLAWLALLPYPVAWGVWQALSLVALACSIWLIVRELRLTLYKQEWVTLGCALVLFPPLAFHLVYAHTELFLLLTLTFAWLCLRRDRTILAGLLLGLAAATRLYPVLFILFLLQRRAWKALVAAAGAAVGISALAGLACDPGAYLRYGAIQREVIPNLYGLQGNASLWGMVFKVASLRSRVPGASLVPIVLGFLASLGIVAATFLLVRRAQAAAPASQGTEVYMLDRGFALYTVACLLASPLAWVYYQVLLYLPFLVLLARLKERPCRRCLWAIGVAAIAALSPFATLLWRDPPTTIKWLQALFPTVTPAATLVALALLPSRTVSGADTRAESDLTAGAP